jgi:hypothetical protein
MPLYLNNGSLLLSPGGLAASSSCCCDDVCSETADCQQPEGDPVNCVDILPEAPVVCCNGVCKPWACYPGAYIRLQFRKKVGCTAAFLAGIEEGEEFEVVVIDDGLICPDSQRNFSAPCDTSWTTSRPNCVITDVAFSTVGLPLCAACYEFLGWSACRIDCRPGAAFGDCWI